MTEPVLCPIAPELVEQLRRGIYVESAIISIDENNTVVVERLEQKEADRVIQTMAGALDLALSFFVARDEMNAAVHASPVRWSPVTEQVRHALQAWKRRPAGSCAYGHPNCKLHPWVL